MPETLSYEQAVPSPELFVREDFFVELMKSMHAQIVAVSTEVDWSTFRLTIDDSGTVRMRVTAGPQGLDPEVGQTWRLKTEDPDAVSLWRVVEISDEYIKLVPLDDSGWMECPPESFKRRFQQVTGPA